MGLSKSEHYQNLGLDVQVLIADEDVTADVERLGEINTAADFPVPTAYKVGSISLSLIDADGTYSPDNPDNFFTANGAQQSGIGASVEIKAGFLVEPITYETIFTGVIARTNYNPVTGALSISVFNDLHTLYSHQITDFGVQRDNFHIDADPDSEELHGKYEIAPWALPFSDDSVEVKKSLNEVLTEQPLLRSEGDLDSDNYVVVDDGIETEGGLIEGASTGYPQAEGKSPYRYISVENAVQKLIADAGFADTDIEIDLPTRVTEPYLASRGRVPYSVVGSADASVSSNLLTWQGFVSDMLYHDNAWWYLICPRIGDYENLPLIIKETDAGDSSVVFRFPQLKDGTRTRQAWEFGISTDDYIYVLCTDVRQRASQSSHVTDARFPFLDSDSTPYIVRLTTSGTGLTDYVKKSGTYHPLLYRKYIFGQTYGDRRPPELVDKIPPQQVPNVVADNRRALQVVGSAVYFAFYTDTQVGVRGQDGRDTFLKAFNRDGRGNQYGVAFDVSGDKVAGALTFIEDGRSRIIAF